ncbi:MAG: hypothetical protein EAZ55_03685 [Cytophagales bacterium]|nr:MAG: hypothetical protein EAZ55_03685 [Cytophagales bacterium]
MRKKLFFLLFLTLTTIPFANTVFAQQTDVGNDEESDEAPITTVEAHEFDKYVDVFRSAIQDMQVEDLKELDLNLDEASRMYVRRKRRRMIKYVNETYPSIEMFDKLTSNGGRNIEIKIRAMDDTKLIFNFDTKTGIMTLEKEKAKN